MTKQAEALKLAEELLADIELTRLSPEQCILKGVRLARLASDEDAQIWLGYELHGYDTAAPRWRELMAMTNRWSNEEKTKAYIEGYSRFPPKVQTNNGCDGCSERVYRATVIGMHDPPSFEIRDDPLDHGTDLVDLLVEFFFPAEKFTAF
jgi:hypothetical protein